MKKIIALTLISSFFLTGCISTRSSVNNGLDVFTEEHYTATDPAERFSLELPQGFELRVVQDENDASGARLLAIIPEGAGEDEAVVVLEENIAQADEVIPELIGTGAIKERSRETIEINGVEADIFRAQIVATRTNTEYIFVRPGNRTYIFSLPGGEPWGYFESVAKTLQYLKDGPAVTTRSATQQTTVPEVNGITIE